MCASSQRRARRSSHTDDRHGAAERRTQGRRAMTYTIEATGLVKNFGTTQALAGVDLAARQGTVHAVLGPNGAGKTTTVRILATLIRADAGSARIGGYDVDRQAQQVRQTIGLTGQYA